MFGLVISQMLSYTLATWLEWKCAIIVKLYVYDFTLVNLSDMFGHRFVLFQPPQNGWRTRCSPYGGSWETTTWCGSLLPLLYRDDDPAHYWSKSHYVHSRCCSPFLTVVFIWSSHIHFTLSQHIVQLWPPLSLCPCCIPIFAATLSNLETCRSHSASCPQDPLLSSVVGPSSSSRPTKCDYGENPPTTNHHLDCTLVRELNITDNDKILHERNISTRIKNFNEPFVEVRQHLQSHSWCRCSEVAVLWHSLTTAVSSCRQHLLFALCWLISPPPGGYALYPTKPVRPSPPLTAIFPHRGPHTEKWVTPFTRIS